MTLLTGHRAPRRDDATACRSTVRQPWQASDLLLVDNIRTAHAREPFDAPREVVVGMADPVRLTE